MVDTPDLTPRFLKPDDQPTPTEFMLNKIDFTIDFFENQDGRVFDLLAESRNQQPLGNISYEIVPLIKGSDPTEVLAHFDIRQSNESKSIWYLNCFKGFNLSESDEKDIAFIVRAYESSTLYTDKRILVQVKNGDLCRPVFDKESYSFEVVENIREMLGPLFVNDCDNGVNGRIILSTTNPDFEFKMPEVYRHGRLGLEMKKSIDFEELMQATGHDSIEFDIIASSSNLSTKRYVARARVTVTVIDLNEFIPKFVKPAPNEMMNNGQRTSEQQKLFFYDVPENVDFHLAVQAVDSDRIGLGELTYNYKYINERDQFQIVTSYSKG